eukprot:scaffold874_cov126-Cylindrotheca_fusiformis.AAC.6
MKSSLSSSLPFQDTSVDCAICLEPLDDNDDKETITLSCGHRWHLDCLTQQLETTKPSATKRLLFSGCQCAKCGVICEHPKLEALTRTTDRLRAKVNRLLREQLDDGADEESELSRRWRLAKHDSAEQERILKEAMRKFSFYLCSHCQEPYSGGTVECADLEEKEELRLCMACTPQLVCRNPTDHLASILWKCRYCCQPATHVCYGNVHFCNACHERNSQRVRQQQRQRQRGTVMGSEPPSLPAVPCPGSSCPFPKPRDRPCHLNGPSPDCEQVYSCVRCQSSSDDNDEQEEEGSHNLLVNPSGADGLRGWQRMSNGAMMWKVEESEIPVNASTTTNFVSSFRPCIMHQTIDLSSLLEDYDDDRLDPEQVRIQVSARYMARTDCPSVFRMHATIASRQQRAIQRLSTAVLDAPPDYWGKATLTFQPVSLRHPEEAKYVQIIVVGQDRRFWQGNFGSKVADCSVRILWNSPGGERSTQRGRQPAGEAIAPPVTAQAQPPNNIERQEDIIQRQGWFLRELVVPVAIFLFLTWLAQG